MTPADEPEFARIVAGMASQKPGKPLTKEGVEVFWMCMQAWTIEEFKTAAMHLMGAVEFMPNAYHFEQLRKAGQPTAAEAFASARQILRKLNPREYIGHVSGDAKLDLALRSVGGYEALAMCTSENIGFLERRFADAYEGITDAEAVRVAVPQIAGVARLGGPQRASLQLVRG